MKNSAPIGFLDSGIGGSTVLIKTLSVLPNENYVFFSDSANCPYGDKSDGEIIERCDKIVSFLIKNYGCKAIVIACNTASAKASAYLREKYSLPIIAIEPAYKMVYDQNPDGFTLVMATKGTLESEKFHKLYYKYNNHKTALIACVGLAPRSIAASARLGSSPRSFGMTLKITYGVQNAICASSMVKKPFSICRDT